MYLKKTKKTVLALGLLMTPFLSYVAHADNRPQLMTLDSLPPAQRAQVYQKIVGQLRAHPELAPDSDSILAVDKDGQVYEVKKEDAAYVVRSAIASPSCTVSKDAASEDLD